MSLKIAVGQFFLIALAYSLCANPLQPEGQCTDCGPLDVLIDRTCYAKIRGCLKHQAGPICIQCQFGYVLSKGTCVREAVFFNLTNTTIIPPVKIDTGIALTSEDIRNRLGQIYGNYLSDAHQYFIGKYPQLEKSNIKNVDKLETRKGGFLAIEYQGESLNRYLAVAFVDNTTDLVTEWSFEPSGNVRRDPVTASNAVQVAIGSRLTGYQIYDLNQTGDIYTINYINQANDFIRVSFNKNDVGSTNFSSKITVKNLTFNDFALEQILAAYPFYKGQGTTTFQKYDGMYVLNIGIVASISFQFINGRFIINKPYDLPSVTPIPNTTASAGGIFGVLVGGFSNFTNYSDSRFVDSIEAASKEFPQLIGAQVIRVQSQVVAGTNFIINLQKTINSTVTDYYQLRIWYTLQKIANLIEIKKNGVVIESENYNYNADANFLNNYNIVRTQSRVINISPIQSVSFRQTTGRRYYKVSYTPNEYSQFEYLTSTSKANLISFIVDGQNLLKLLAGAQVRAEQRSPQILLNFLQSKQSIANRSQIQDLNIQLPLYTLTVVTKSGTYKAVIEDSGGEMKLNQFTQISNSSCFDMKASDVISNDKISIIDGFLKANYPLTDFNIQLVQVNVQNASIVYRMLYASLKLKQIEIYVEEKDSTANVIKASYINFGYEVVDSVIANADYSKITSIMKNSTLTGNKIPFFTQVNDSMIKSYYDDGKSTSQIYYDKSANKASAQVVATRSYLIVPDGFNLSNLIVPGQLSSTNNATLNKIYQQALKKYSVVIKDATLVFATKQNNSYVLMYKNSYGYQKLQVTIDILGTVNLGRLIITAYKDSDFSNCKQFNSDGKCLSCNPDLQVQYQGYCWKKLDGCLIQPGGICAKCNINYVKSSQKCYKQCSSFFN